MRIDLKGKRMWHKHAISEHAMISFVLYIRLSSSDRRRNTRSRLWHDIIGPVCPYNSSTARARPMYLLLTTLLLYRLYILPRYLIATQPFLAFYAKTRIIYTHDITFVAISCLLGHKKRFAIFQCNAKIAHRVDSNFEHLARDHPANRVAASVFRTRI